MELKFKIENQSIRRIDKNNVVENSKNYLTATFLFETDDWDGFAKIVLFKNNDIIIPMILVNDTCIVPWEVVTKGKIEVSLYGTLDTQIITSDISSVIVGDSLYGEEETPPTPEPTPNIIDQLNTAITAKADNLDYVDNVLSLKSGNTTLSTVTITNGESGEGTNTNSNWNEVNGKPFSTVCNTNGLIIDNNQLDIDFTKVQSILSDATIENSGMMSAADKEKLDEMVIPTNTSDLNNDSNFIVDENYIHIDNNYTTEEKTKLENIADNANENIIESISVNGITLEPDENKNVNIEINDTDVNQDEVNVTIYIDLTLNPEDLSHCYVCNYTATEIIQAYYYEGKKIIGNFIDTIDTPTYTLMPLRLIYLHETQNGSINDANYVIFQVMSSGQMFFFSIDDTSNGSIVTWYEKGIENTNNKVQSINSLSTNSQYTSAKCVYDAIESAKQNTYNYVDGESICGTYMGETVYRYCYTRDTEIYIDGTTMLDIGMDATNVNKIIRLGATGGNGNLLNGGKDNNRIVLNCTGHNTYFPSDTTFWVEYIKD